MAEDNLKKARRAGEGVANRMAAEARDKAIKKHHFLPKDVGHMRCFTELRSKVAREACHALHNLLHVRISATLTCSNLRQDVGNAIRTPVYHSKA